MTDIEQKALELVNEAFREPYYKEWSQVPQGCLTEALCRAIEQHEAFRRDVSDAVTGFDEYGTEAAWERLSRFIIAKPDPLVEAWLEAFPGNHIDDAQEECAKISAALAARGLEVRKIGEGE